MACSAQYVATFQKSLIIQCSLSYAPGIEQTLFLRNFIFLRHAIIYFFFQYGEETRIIFQRLLNCLSTSSSNIGSNSPGATLPSPSESTVLNQTWVGTRDRFRPGLRVGKQGRHYKNHKWHHFSFSPSMTLQFRPFNCEMRSEI